MKTKGNDRDKELFLIPHMRVYESIDDVADGLYVLSVLLDGLFRTFAEEIPTAETLEKVNWWMCATLYELETACRALAEEDK